MHTQRREEIEAVFEDALEYDAADRDAWLSARCAGDAALRAEVDALLLAHSSSFGILEHDAAAFARAIAAAPPAERRIGPYRVIREIGRGGMGVVYLAERADGAFRRQVAIKLLRNSPDAEELHRRFVAERQILASLSHPNIAQLLDGGTTDGQLPYLVMEHVDGLPITTYCDRHRLDVDARLALFEDVCHAVHAAHQNLVIHRDLKPSNILVTADGTPKLLDFGIAKLLNPTIASLDVPHTRTAFRVMTPEYASPEQVRGETLTTASDTYALGVVLYELLAGRRPYELRTGAPGELQELVCEREPERPSTGAVRRESLLLDDGSTREHVPDVVAAARGVSPERLRRQLRGDIDAIVLMALRKEPRRRYASAELMSEDIRRYRERLPVSAHHGTRAYRMSKFLGRHRVAVVAGALAAISLAAGAAVAANQAAVASRERDRAEQALARAEQALDESDEMTGFLVGLFDISSPMPASVGSLTADDLLRRGELQVERLRGQPLVQARMLDVMGRVYRSLGRYGDAREALERSLVLLTGRDDVGGTQAATTMLHLSDVLRRQGHYASADTMTRRTLALRRRLLGDGHPAVAEALEQLSGILVYRGDLAGATSLARQAVAIHRAATPPDEPRLAASLELLSNRMRRLGDVDEGERLLVESLRLYERALGEDPLVAFALLRVGDLLLDERERPDEAETYYARAAGMLRRTLGEDHPQYANAIASLGDLYSRRGRHDEAERLNRRALAIYVKVSEPEAPGVGGMREQLAMSLMRAGRYAEAEREQRLALRISERVFGREHSAYAGSVSGLGAILLAAGRLDEAEAAYRSTIDIRRRALGGEAALLGITFGALGDVYARRGDAVRADSLYHHGLAILRRHVGSAHLDVRHIHRRLAALYASQGRVADAALHRRLGEAPTRAR